MKLMSNDRVKIKMTSGRKTDEVRVVDVQNLRKNETQEETQGRRAAHAKALFGDTK